MLEIQQQNREKNTFPSRNYTSCGEVCFRKYHGSENATVENRKLQRAQISGLIVKPGRGNGEAGEGQRSLGLMLRFAREGLGFRSISICGEKKNNFCIQNR